MPRMFVTSLVIALFAAGQAVAQEQSGNHVKAEGEASASARAELRQQEPGEALGRLIAG